MKTFIGTILSNNYIGLQSLQGRNRVPDGTQCLDSSSASHERVRGKGLWPAPALCPRESVSFLSLLLILTQSKKFLCPGRIHKPLST